MQPEFLTNGELVASPDERPTSLDLVTGGDGPSVRCNVVGPSWIMTEMAADGFALAKNSQRAMNAAAALHASGRLGKPEDVANAVAWLLGKQAAFVTGQCFVIDGGLTSAFPLRPELF